MKRSRQYRRGNRVMFSVTLDPELAQEIRDLLARQPLRTPMTSFMEEAARRELARMKAAEQAK